MKKLIIILLITLPLFLKAQTTPVSPSQMNQVTWYYEPSTTLRWGFNSTRGWFLVPDSAKVVQWAGGSGDTISFTNNFKNTGTVTNAIIDLADTIRTNFADFKRGMTTGDPASSMDYHYVSKRNVLGNEVQSRHGVTSSGPGGTYISTYFGNDSTHAKAVAVRLDKNYPEYTKLAGLDRHNIAVIDNCVGCTLDTSTYTLTITGGGGVTSVSGTINRVTSTGGTTPVIDISATFEALLGKVANPLSQFASTTSLQLAGVISNETGSGSLVFGTSPTLATPVINVGSDATGDIYYRSSGGAFTRLPIGSSTNVLTVTGGLPVWAAATGGGGTYTANETPSGSVNSSNTSYTLAHTPVSGTVSVYLNGLYQVPSVDYTISSGTITYSSAPFTGDSLRVIYQY